MLHVIVELVGSPWDIDRAMSLISQAGGRCVANLDYKSPSQDPLFQYLRRQHQKRISENSSPIPVSEV